MFHLRFSNVVTRVSLAQRWQSWHMFSVNMRDHFKRTSKATMTIVIIKNQLGWDFWNIIWIKLKNQKFKNLPHFVHPGLIHFAKREKSSTRLKGHQIFEMLYRESKDNVTPSMDIFPMKCPHKLWVLNNNFWYKAASFKVSLPFKFENVAFSNDDALSVLQSF